MLCVVYILLLQIMRLLGSKDKADVRNRISSGVCSETHCLLFSGVLFLHAHRNRHIWENPILKVFFSVCLL